jgi:glutamyl-tRNA synthetase
MLRPPMARTRYAPSPTGALHLGGARTAAFNWAYARHHGGSFVLRIEDTDRERSTPESEAAMRDGLAWLGLDWDEGPFRQSEHQERHAAVVEELLAADRAYRCICTREDLEARREASVAAGKKWTYDGRCREAAHGPGCGPHVVRLRVAGSGRLSWDDLVFGESGQDADEIGDVILRRTDGTPLFHLAVVVDDLDMKIDTVIRGADHHLNTCIHLAIYRALDVDPPRYAHVPLIVGAGGRKLSKREAAASVQQYRDAGYVSEALLNWMIRWGWSHGDRETFGPEEIIELFDLGAVGRGAAQVDPAKLDWLGQYWLKKLPADELWTRLEPFLEADVGRPVTRTPELDLLVGLLRERSTTLAEMTARARFALVDEVTLDEKAVAKHLNPAVGPLLGDLRARLAALPTWSAPELERTFEAVRAANGDLAMGKLAQPVRVAVTGGTASPGIFETLVVVGRDRTLARLDAATRASAAIA